MWGLALINMTDHNLITHTIWTLCFYLMSAVSSVHKELASSNWQKILFDYVTNMVHIIL